MGWKKAAELYFRMAEWFAENEPGTPVPEWCELSWPIRKEQVKELFKLYKEDILKPSDIDPEEEFLAVFGMREMEMAAKKIVDKCRENNWKVPIICEDFENDLERTGFIELIGKGWLEHGQDNGQFFVKTAFVRRLRKHYG
jgi:hypothetical protein